MGHIRRSYLFPSKGRSSLGMERIVFDDRAWNRVGKKTPHWQSVKRIRKTFYLLLDRHFDTLSLFVSGITLISNVFSPQWLIITRVSYVLDEMIRNIFYDKKENITECLLGEKKCKRVSHERLYAFRYKFLYFLVVLESLVCMVVDIVVINFS